MRCASASPSSQRVPRGEVDMVALFPDGATLRTWFANHAIPEHTPEEIIAAKESK